MNNQNDINEKEKYEIIQLLPFFIKANIPFMEALCASVKKKDTGGILQKLKQLNFSLDEVHLKANNYIPQNVQFDYQKPNPNQKPIDDKENYNKFNCSFLKRVKPYDNANNLLLITFTDELNFRNIKEDDISLLLGIQKEQMRKVFIPSIQPISEEQYDYCKSKWPISLFVSSKGKFIYSHSKEEVESMSLMFNELLNDKNATSLLYSPKENKVLAKGKEKKGSLINHSIMNLIENYSCSLNSSLNNLHQKNKKGPIENSISLFNDNNLLSQLQSESQYYCEGLYVMTIREPCIMCAMALVHNRINRIYFRDLNKDDGGLISSISINDFNLNHHYNIFKINNKK